MRSSRFRFLAAAAAPLAFLAVTACGPDDSGGADGDSSTASPGDDAAATSAGPSDDLTEVAVEQDGEGGPVLTWNGEPFPEGDLPFVTNETQVEQLAEGDGDEVGAEDDVLLHYLAVNGANGEQIVSTFGSDETVIMDLTDEALFPAFRDELPGTAAGDELLMALPASEAFGPYGNDQLGVGPEDSLVFYLEVVDSYPVQGEPVDPVEGLPTVTSDGENPAEIDVEGVEPPDELIAQPLVQGEGPELEEGDTAIVHYTGVKLSDGEQFDSSYLRGQPFTLTLGQGGVIKGWEDGLLGQNVRSEVLLVIPAEDAYGAAATGGTDDDASTTAPQQHELAGEDLVFVVDIIGKY